MPWMKRARQTNEPTTVSKQVTKRAKLSTVIPQSEVPTDIDLRNVADEPTYAQLQDFTIQLMMVSEDSCYLQALCEQQVEKARTTVKDREAVQPVQHLTVKNKLKAYINSLPLANCDCEQLHEDFVRDR